MQPKCIMCNKHTASNMPVDAERMHHSNNNEKDASMASVFTSEAKQLEGLTMHSEPATPLQPNQGGGRVYKNCCSHHLLPLGRFCHIPDCKEDRQTCQHAKGEIARIDMIQRRAAKTME